MYSKMRNVAVFAACFLGFAAVAPAQVSGIEGVVKGPDGTPIQGAIIKIERKDIKGNYNVKTDKKGHYGHYGLPLGTYKLTLEVDGKDVDRVDNVRTRLGDPLTIPFNLRPPKPAQAASTSGQAPQQAAPPPEKDRSMSKEEKAAMDKAMKEREAQIAKNKALNDSFQAGKAAMEAKNYTAAVDAFKKASELEGGDQAVIWANLADAYSAAAKEKPTEAAPLREGAAEAYKKAIEKKPDDATLYNNYALVLGYEKKIPEAQAALEKAAQLDPPGAGRYYYNLGAVLVNTGQNEPAGAAFKKAIDADPNYADAQYQYGIFLTSQAKTDASGKVTAVPGTIEAFQKYLELKPDGPFAEQAKGMIQMLGGTVQTTFKNPSAPSKTKTPAKKK
jgi:tetratricopeptide (TPR) repeat protein